MITETKIRGHRKENIEKNQAVISLYLCGFSQWAISKLVRMDRRNVQKCIRKYLPRHLEAILEREIKVISNRILKKNGR